jgi:hypothetical protein
MSNARRYAPVLIATVTPQSVETHTGTNGPYTKMQGALVQRSGKDDLIRTVMAFGGPNEKVSALLEVGVPVVLALRHDGGTMKVVGLPRAAAVVIADPTRIVIDVLTDAGMDADMARATYDAMVSGSDDRPAEPAMDLDPDMLETMGTIVLPIVDAGFGIDEAVGIAKRMLDSDAAEHLRDAATLIRQNAARAFA